MVKISIPVQTVCFILCAIPHFHDDQWESPEKNGWRAALFQDFHVDRCARLPSQQQTLDAMETRSSVVSCSLQHSAAWGSQGSSGGQCQCGLQRWGLPLSRGTAMKRKEGRRGRTLKTHSGRPEAAGPPQLQWGSYENKTFHGPS